MTRNVLRTPTPHPSPRARAALAALAPLAAGLLAAAAPSAAAAQVTPSFACRGGVCDIVDLTFSFAGGSRSLTSLGLDNGGFAGFIFQNAGFGGQFNDVSPPTTGAGDAGRVWTGAISGGTLTTAACASTDPSYPLCGPSTLAGSATITVYFQGPTIGSAADFAKYVTFTIGTSGPGGAVLPAESGGFSGTVTPPPPPSTVPEPASVALVALGLAGVAAGAARRRAGGAMA